MPSQSNIEKIELIINEVESFIKNENENKLLDEKNVSELKIALADLIEMKKDISNDEDAAELLAEISHFMHQQKLAPDFPDEINHLVDQIHEIIAWDVQFAPLAYPKDTLTIDEIKWEKVESLLCFRGDFRDPGKYRNIFKNGFIPKKNNFNEIIVSSPFITQDGVVQGSSRFLAAALFPFFSIVKKVWVYIYAPEEIFNVHQHGCVRLWSNWVHLNPDNAKKDLSSNFAAYMYVHEIITRCVPPTRIIAAVNIQRFSDGQEYKKEIFNFYNGIRNYHILGYKMNPNCTLPVDIISRAEKFIKDEIAANLRSCHLPLPASGYVRNSLFRKNKMTIDDAKDSSYKAARKKTRYF